MSLKVVGISGSLRKGSYNSALLRAAQELTPDDMTIEIVSIAAIPLYNDDVRHLGLPKPVVKLRQQISAADALLIATPEYNLSVPGVLKNALDWASRRDANGLHPFHEKPAAIMGVATGAFGTVRAQMHLREILFHLNCYTVNKPEVLVMHAREKFDSNLKLVDEPTRGFVSDLLIALKSLTTKLNSERVGV